MKIQEKAKCLIIYNINISEYFFNFIPLYLTFFFNLINFNQSIKLINSSFKLVNNFYQEIFFE